MLLKHQLQPIDSGQGPPWAKFPTSLKWQVMEGARRGLELRPRRTSCTRLINFNSIPRVQARQLTRDSEGNRERRALRRATAIPLPKVMKLPFQELHLRKRSAIGGVSVTAVEKDGDCCLIGEVPIRFYCLITNRGYSVQAVRSTRRSSFRKSRACSLLYE